MTGERAAPAATSTVEDYLKQIYLIEERDPAARAPNGALATALGVTPASVTTMMKTLAEAGLVDYEAYSGARLSAAGRRLAVRVVRRHRLVELFLVRVLELDWSEVHDEAERLEHAVSDLVVERMDAHLGRPTVDPHGHPIPSAEGDVGAVAAIPLAEVEAGERVRVARVSDHDGEFLKAIERLGLRPGAAVKVTARDDATDSLVVALGRGRAETLGLRAAARILVER